MNTSSSGPAAPRWIGPGWVGPALAVGLLVVTVAAVLTTLLASGDVEDLPPGSPEAAVQAYAQAVVDGDAEEILAALDPAAECTLADIEDPDGPGAWIDDDLRVLLEEVTVSDDTGDTGDTARVSVRITHGGGGLLPDEWTEQETFRLTEADGEWLITGQPWPYYYCSTGKP